MSSLGWKSTLMGHKISIEMHKNNPLIKQTFGHGNCVDNLTRRKRTTIIMY